MLVDLSIHTEGREKTLVTWWEIEKLWYLPQSNSSMKGKKGYISEFDAVEGIRGNQRGVNCVENQVV